MDGVILTSLKQIHHPKGDVYHAIKQSDNGFRTFGEAYFSTIHQNCIKGWKKHTKMTLNLVVPVGSIEFVLFDDRENSPTKGEFFTTISAPSSYQRLSIPPNVWMAFRGLEKFNLLLNVADLEHDPAEALTLDLDTITYEW
jgi:dTDP-4-dehydrorhamnose 3,5-epimerase